MEIIELYEIIISNSRYLVVIIVEEQASSVHKSRFNNQYEPSLVKPQSIEKIINCLTVEKIIVYKIY